MACTLVLRRVSPFHFSPIPTILFVPTTWDFQVALFTIKSSSLLPLQRLLIAPWNMKHKNLSVGRYQSASKTCGRSTHSVSAGHSSSVSSGRDIKVATFPVLSYTLNSHLRGIHPLSQAEIAVSNSLQPPASSFFETFKLNNYYFNNNKRHALSNFANDARYGHAQRRRVRARTPPLQT